MSRGFCVTDSWSTGSRYHTKYDLRSTVGLTAAWQSADAVIIIMRSGFSIFYDEPAGGINVYESEASDD